MEMFTPQLTLLVEPDGEFTIHATALVPLSGYVVAGVKPGVPPANVRLTAETFPLLLLLRRFPSPGFQIPHVRNWEVSNQNLTGKKQVFAFVCLLDGPGPETILGQSNVPVAASYSLPTKDAAALGSDWQAWVSEDAKTLFVRGVVKTPTPGYKVSIEPTSPQGINPKILMLDVKLTKLPGIWPQVVTSMPVAYEQANHDYTTVHINEPNGQSSIIPLQRPSV